jgi:hypothetical protein
VDGYSHHDHQKRDLQVSKKGVDVSKKGEWSKSMREAKGVNQGNGTVNVFMHVYLFCTCYLGVTLIVFRL